MLRKYSVPLIMVMAIFTFATIRALNEYRWSFWAYGDAQMLNAGLHFRNEGFIKHHFLPLVNPGHVHNLIPNNGPNGRYSHYPALHAVIIGFLGNFFDNPLIPSRIMAIFFGSVSVFFWYLTIRNLYGSTAGLISGLFIGISVLSLEFIDALCGQPYDEFFRASAVFLFLLVETRRDGLGSLRARLCYLGLWGLMFLESLNSVEYIPFLFLFPLGAYLLWGRFKESIGKLALFASAPILGLSIHLLQTATEFGGIDRVVSDWKDVITNRVTSQSVGFHTGALGGLLALYFERLSTLTQYLITYLLSNYWQALAGFLLFVALRFFGKHRQIFDVIQGDKARIWMVLFVSSLGFLLFLPAHSYNMRDYIPKHIFPSFSILFGLAGQFFVGRFSDATRSGRLPRFSFPTLLYAMGIVLIALPFVKIGKYIAGYPNLLNTPKWAIEEMALSDWSDRILQARIIQMKTSPGDIILVPENSRGNSDYEANAVEEYYAQRHLVPMGHTPSDLLSRIERLYLYRDEFVSKEPRLRESHIVVFVDRERVPDSLYKKLTRDLSCKPVEGEKQNDRFQFCAVNRLPEPDRRSAKTIFRDARAIWTFDRTVEGQFYDIVGNRPVTPTNVRIAKGKINSGVRFDGASSYLQASMSLLGWKTFSIAFWVRPENRTDNEIAVILDNGSDEHKNFAVQSDGTSSSRFSWIYGTQGSFELPVERWTYVVVTADTIADRIEVYLNGEKEFSSPTRRLVTPGSVPLTFGKWANANTRYFKGILDEVAVWDYVIDEADVRTLFDNRDSPSVYFRNRQPSEPGQSRRCPSGPLNVVYEALVSK
jgi:hypothetical protein